MPGLYAVGSPRAVVVALVALAGCGRLGFEQTPGGEGISGAFFGADTLVADHGGVGSPLQSGTLALYLRAPATGGGTLAEIGGWQVALEPGRVRVTSGDIELAAAISWAVDSRHLIVVRWDRVPLRGAAYAELLIDGVVAASGEEPVSTPVMPATVVWGSESPVVAAVLLRRPLAGDGAGPKVFSSDELRALGGPLGEGSSEIPSWDLLLAVDADRRPYCSAAESAVGQPFADNLLGAGLPVAQRWEFVGEGAPVAAPSEEDLFGGSLLVPVGSLTQDIDLPSGTSVVFRALVHADEGGQPVAGLTYGDGVVRRRMGRETSTRFDLDEIIVTAEIPAPFSRMQAFVGNQAQVGNVYVHDVQLLTNSVPNPSFEFGAGTDPYQPDQWILPELGGTYSREVGHSGDASLRIDTFGAQVSAAGVAVVPTQVDCRAYGLGGSFSWLDGPGAGIFVTNGSLFGFGKPLGETNKLYAEGHPIPGWQRVGGFGMRLLNSEFNNHLDRVHWGGGAFHVEARVDVDDAYLFPLSAVAAELR